MCLRQFEVDGGEVGASSFLRLPFRCGEKSLPVRVPQISLHGEILAEGTPAEIQQNPTVQEVYLKI